MPVCPGYPDSKAAKIWRREHFPKRGNAKERAALLNDLPVSLEERLRELRRRREALQK